MKRIGFIGVGSIGAPMARCVARAGFELTVCDTNASARDAFKAQAVRLTDRAADCVDQDMTIVMVNNDEQVKEVVLGDDGLLSNKAPGVSLAVAIMSTVLPQTITLLAEACRGHDIVLVDAPVSGLPVVAEQGKLSIMVGGEEADLEIMRPVLEAMGENIYFTGGLGSGEVTKLVNNIVGLTNLFLVVEAMQVGQAYGMESSVLANVMETSSGRNFSTEDWERGKATFAYFAQSPELIKVAVDLCRKDLTHAHELSSIAEVSCPLFDQILGAFNAFRYDEIEKSWSAVAES